MTSQKNEAKRGYAIYTPLVLSGYDLLVHGLSNRFVWGCPTQRILALYADHLSSNHLDVGVGTGYFLKKTLRDPDARVALLDASEHSLAFAAKRLKKFHPEVYKRDVTDNLVLACDDFDSIAMTYVLHCLPGDIESRSALFDELCASLTDNGVVFGSALLSLDIERSFAAKTLMRHYNRRGIFSNEYDSLGDLMKILSTRFRTFNVEVNGCAVLFWGKGPKMRVVR